MKQILSYLLILVLMSCSKEETFKDIRVNETDMNFPSIMIIPSDALLNKLGCLTIIDNQGINSYIRDYNKAFISNSDLKFVIAVIENSFSNAGYKLENLEQQLKSIENETTLDNVETIKKDLRTAILNTARPDIVIDINFEAINKTKTRNVTKILNYQLTALDVFTNKSLASFTRTGIGEEENSNSIQELFQKDLPENIKSFHTLILSHFNDQIKNGVEISLRLTIDANSSFNFTDIIYNEIDYMEWINNWVKKKSLNSIYKNVKNTDYELKFTDIRIKPLDNNGQKFTAFDFANELRKELIKLTNKKVLNRTQSIGDAYLILSER